jgi:hypothetical protein
MSSSRPSYAFDQLKFFEEYDIQTKHITQMFQEKSLDQTFMNIDTDYKTIALREIQVTAQPYDIEFYVDIIRTIENQEDAQLELDFFNDNFHLEPPIQEEAEVNFNQAIEILLEEPQPPPPVEEPPIIIDDSDSDQDNIIPPQGPPTDEEWIEPNSPLPDEDTTEEEATPSDTETQATGFGFNITPLAGEDEDEDEVPKVVEIENPEEIVPQHYTSTRVLIQLYVMPENSIEEVLTTICSKVNTGFNRSFLSYYYDSLHNQVTIKSTCMNAIRLVLPFRFTWVANKKNKFLNLFKIFNISPQEM